MCVFLVTFFQLNILFLLHVAISLNTDVVIQSQPSLGDTWTARFALKPRIAQPKLVSLILYVYNEGPGEMAFVKSPKNSIEEIYGHTPEVRLERERGRENGDTQRGREISVNFIPCILCSSTSSEFTSQIRSFHKMLYVCKLVATNLSR